MCLCAFPHVASPLISVQSAEPLAVLFSGASGENQFVWVYKKCVCVCVCYCKHLCKEKKLFFFHAFSLLYAAVCLPGSSLR